MRPFSEPISRLLREGNDRMSASCSKTAVPIALAAANAGWTLGQLPTAMFDPLNQCGEWLRVWQRSRTGGTTTLPGAPVITAVKTKDYGLTAWIEWSLARESDVAAELHPVVTWLSCALADVEQQRTACQGMSVNDLVGEPLSREVGVPYSDQEALSLSA